MGGGVTETGMSMPTPLGSHMGKVVVTAYPEHFEEPRVLVFTSEAWCHHHNALLEERLRDAAVLGAECQKQKGAGETL